MRWFVSELLNMQDLCYDRQKLCSQVLNFFCSSLWRPFHHKSFQIIQNTRCRHGTYADMGKRSITLHKNKQTLTPEPCDSEESTAIVWNANTTVLIFWYFWSGHDRALFQAPAQSKRISLAVSWWSSPFWSCPKIRHFSFLWKPDCDPEMTASFEDPVWLPSFVSHSSPFLVTPNNQNSALRHCHCTEILVQAMKYSLFQILNRNTGVNKIVMPESKSTLIDLSREHKNEPGAIQN